MDCHLVIRALMMAAWNKSECLMGTPDDWEPREVNADPRVDIYCPS